jgi:hypothetical protein
MTRDPLGIAGGLNLYGFVGNGPMNAVDAQGLFTEVLFVEPSWSVQGGQFGHVAR